jgi:hypothetical protein
MAAVTLKDLMDPLSKIQASTTSTVDAIDQLTQVSIAAGNSTKAGMASLASSVAVSGQMGDGIQGAILAELQLQTQLMRNQKGGGLSALFGGSGGKQKKSNLEQGGNGMQMLGAGTWEMAKALLLFMLVPVKTIMKFNYFVKAQI